MNKNFGKKKEDNLQRTEYVFRIYPNDEEIQLIEKTFGCVRFVYNKILETKKNEWQQNKKDVNLVPAELKQDYPWLKEVDSLALCNAQIDIQNAFKNFFNHKAKYPKFRSKRRKRPSYTTNLVNDNIVLNSDSIKLPKFKNPIKAVVHRPLPDNSKIKRVTVSRSADNNYYVSVMFETIKPEKSAPSKNPVHIGLDYTMDGLYMDSNGYWAEMPKYFRKSEEKLAKAQKKLSKMRHRYNEIKTSDDKKASNNYLKQKQKVGKILTHIKNQRKDFLHKQSANLTDLYDLISVEDIDMRQMSKCVQTKKCKKKSRWGKSVMDNAFGMFRQMLQYKQERKGHTLIKVDRFYPSSQLCNNCGVKNPITKDLNVRIIVCTECGSIYDRDINAAKNVDAQGLILYYRQLGMKLPDVKPGDILSDVMMLSQDSVVMQKCMTQEVSSCFKASA